MWKGAAKGRRQTRFLIVIGMFTLAAERDVAGQGYEHLIPTATVAKTTEYAFALFDPLPRAQVPATAKSNLGKRLFYERGFSADGSMSCASCHDIQNGGDDGKAVSTPLRGAPMRRNAPSILNAMIQSSLFWDGRATSPAEQITELARHATVTGVRSADAKRHTSTLQKYGTLPSEIYGGDLTEHDFADALLAFLRRLITPDSRFDQFLNGDAAALDTKEMAGLERFISLGCGTCHQGPLLGGNLFQKFGVFPGNTPLTTEPATDQGRFEITEDPADRYTFRVPSLRNVALTAPYFHNGSAATLDEAIVLMGHHQTGFELSAETRQNIEAFLRTLTGKVPMDVAPTDVKG